MTTSSLFQFHKGTIKTYNRQGLRRLILHFNSIKVRLKPLYLALDQEVYPFQFHKGTIKTKDYADNLAANLISIP